MSRKRFFTNLILFLTIVVYLVKCHDLDAYDLFETNKFYLNWISALGDMTIDNEFVLNLILETANQIRAFEPISGFIVFLLARIFHGETVIHALNVVFLISFFRLTDLVKNWQVFLLFVVLEIFLGFYSSILLFQTHRLKIAFIVYFILLRYAKESLKLIILPVLSHFSFMVLAPFTLFFAGRTSRLFFKSGYSLMAIVLLLILYSVVKSNPVIDQVILNKLSHIKPFMRFEVGVILMLCGLLYRVVHNRVNGLYILLLYVSALLVLVDLSRVLMMLYLCLYAFAWHESTRSTSLGVLFITFFGWSLYRGLSYSIYI